MKGEKLAIHSLRPLATGVRGKPYRGARTNLIFRDKEKVVRQTPVVILGLDKWLSREIDFSRTESGL